MLSYDELERIDTGLATRTIQLAGNNRVPVPKTIDSSAIIHDAVDNYDNEEGTSSGIGGSHDTILMLFQNAENDDGEDQQQQISKVPAEFVTRRRSLEQILDCQKLVRGGNFATRAEIPENVETNMVYNFQRLSNTVSRWYKAWILNRHVVNSRMPILSSVDSSGIPSFSATNSMLEINMKPICIYAYNPTSCDRI